MFRFFIFIKEIAKGKTVMKAMTNIYLSEYTLEGNILDIGGGEGGSSYYRFFRKSAEAKIKNIDLSANNVEDRIDLEKDALPVGNLYADQVLMFNLLEHIYEHKFVLREISRVLKKGGVLIGFVPFMIAYHPDPHDYFRYSKEALHKLFEEASFEDINIKVVGLGPFLVNYNNIMVLLPIYIRLIIFPFYYFLDLILVKIKPSLRNRFPLGYIFKANKR